MKQANFFDTVNILVKAYLNDTLEHGHCTACAVGNIVTATFGQETRSDGWGLVFRTDPSTLIQDVFMHNYQHRAKDEIDSTGYSVEDLIKIEFAFESAPRNCSSLDGKNEEWMFNGLMAVVTVLAEIHGISLDETEKARKLFNKIPV